MALLTQEIAELDSGGMKVGGGTFAFQDLIGRVILSSDIAETLRRRGVDGAGVRILGDQPRPFQLTATSYESSFSNAKASIASYKGMVGKQYGVKLTLNSIDYGTFDVLSVDEAQPPRAVYVKQSGVAGASAVRHVTTWTLLDRN